MNAVLDDAGFMKPSPGFESLLSKRKSLKRLKALYGLKKPRAFGIKCWTVFFRRKKA